MIGFDMRVTHIALAILMSLLAIFSGVVKLQRNPRVVQILHEVVRVPMEWFPWLAACEFAGALGLLIGLIWRPVGVAAAIGLILYFLGAIIAHLRVGDFKGIGSPAFPLLLACACLVTQILSAYPG